MIEEKLYRLWVDDVFARIDRAFENVDPDLAESSLGNGTLTITFPGRARFILSPQAPVRQIWAAFRAEAWHFSRADADGRWWDDRGRGIELGSLVAGVTQREVSVALALGALVSAPPAEPAR